MYPKIDANEKQQIEQVFGLTGGELADAPLRYCEIVKREPCYACDRERKVGMPAGVGGHTCRASTIKRRWARYFYDGVPEYVAREYARFGGDYLTIVTCELFSQMPRKIRARGREWIKVRSFRSSGEAECPLAQNDGDEEHLRAIHTGDKACPLCGASVGDRHGMIYLGDGWSEVVYLARGSR